MRGGGKHTAFRAFHIANARVCLLPLLRPIMSPLAGDADGEAGWGAILRSKTYLLMLLADVSWR